MGTSSGTQNTQSQTTTQPWAPAQPALQSILGNIQGLQGQSGINPTENAAIQQLTSNAGGLQNFAPQAQQQASAFLGGDPFGIINPSYQQYQNSLAPIANPANLDPMNTPGFGQALNTLNQDITNQINGEFAGAGRSGSGMNTQTLARGLSQGEGGLIQSQYNQNVQNLLGAAGGLQGAGLNTSRALGGNVSGGIGLAGAAPSLATQGPSALLSAGQTPFNLQASNQGALAGLTVPIADLGGQSNTNASGGYTGSLSPIQQAAGIGSLFGGQYSPVSGIQNTLGGILGGLGNIFGPNMRWGG